MKKESLAILQDLQNGQAAMGTLLRKIISARNVSW